MLGRNANQRENRKFFVLATVVCALIILVVVSISQGHFKSNLNYNDWIELAQGK